MADPTHVADSAADTTLPPVPEEGSQAAPQPPSGPASSGQPADAMLAMIERAARDPSVDLAKLQGLMGMKQDIERERASIAFAEAFADLGPDLPVIDRNGQIIIYSKKDRTEEGVREGAEPIQRTRYATLDDLLEALREPLAKHGFSLRFEHQAIADGRMTTTAILRHRLGHYEMATTPPLQHDSSGSKNSVQAVGSALTYGRRYALMALLPITSHAPQDADDDGQAAGKALIDADQLALLQQLIAETKSDEAKFFETVGADGFASMTVKQFKRGKTLLEEKKRRAARPKAAQ